MLNGEKMDNMKADQLEGFGYIADGLRGQTETFMRLSTRMTNNMIESREN